MIFGFCSLGDFIKEDLARDDKEGAEEGEERGEKSRARRRGNYWSFGGGYRSIKDGFSSVNSSSSRKKFGDKSNGRDRVEAKDKDGYLVFNSD